LKRGLPVGEGGLEGIGSCFYLLLLEQNRTEQNRTEPGDLRRFSAFFGDLRRLAAQRLTRFTLFSHVPCFAHFLPVSLPFFTFQCYLLKRYFASSLSFQRHFSLTKNPLPF
jgi:hypothetical protein